MTRVSSKLAKVAKAKTVAKSAPAALGIANFLASAPLALLSAARPVAVAPAGADDEDEDEDGEGSGDDEDERLLELRRLTNEEEFGEDGEGNDWMAHFAGSSEEEDEEEGDGGSGAEEEAGEEEDEEEEEEEEEAPPPPPRKAAKPAKPPSASLQARPALALGAEASARVTVLEARGGKAEGRATAATAAAQSAPAAQSAAAAAPPPPPKEKRPLPAAFLPKDARACIYAGNLPLDADTGALSAKLAAFGVVKRVHLELGNNGKPQGFGYVEFATPAAAAAAAAGAFELAGRAAKLLPYTPELNYRNPDGSRRKEKKKKQKDAVEEGGGGGGGRGGGGGGGRGGGGGGGGGARGKKRERE